MDLLEHAVRNHENFMGIPYPRKYVTVLVMDIEEDLARKGTSDLVLAVGVAPSFHDAGDAIAHQAAHAYWPTSPDVRVLPGWISEGASTFLASRLENSSVGAAIPELPEVCSKYSSLRDLGETKLDWSNYSNSNNVFLTCDSALGEEIFLGLYRDLGVEAFRQGFATLSLVVHDVLEDGLARGPADPCRNSTHWAFRDRCYLNDSFGRGATTLEEAQAIRATIQRLYDGEPRSDPPPTPASPDRATLVALYHATGGPNWDDNRNWLSNWPIGQWPGVTTDGDGRDTGLNLSFNQLSGQIPTELGKLTSLQILGLGDNQLSGAIPAELGSLSNLQTLGLGDNQLNGAIPAELGGLSNLRSLGLGDNQLSGPIPAELGSLLNLRGLLLSDNSTLSGPLPGPFTGLTSLTTLWLDGTELCAPTDSEFQAWLHGLETTLGVVNCVR